MLAMLHESIKVCQAIKEKLWGKEYWIANFPTHCGKLLVLKQKYRCSVHYHKIKEETFFIVSGVVLLEYDDNQRTVMTPGHAITIKPFQRHRFTGLAPISEIIEFSSQHFEDDSYREDPSGKISEQEWEDSQEKLWKEYGNEY